MIKLIILCIVFYFFYRSIKSWISPSSPNGKSVGGDTPGSIDDVMVKDPYCEAYFPQRKGVHLKIDGQDLYFCSVACRDSYLAAKPEKNGGATP